MERDVSVGKEHESSDDSSDGEGEFDEKRLERRKKIGDAQDAHERILELNVLLARIQQEELQEQQQASQETKGRSPETIPSNRKPKLHFDLYTVSNPFVSLESLDVMSLSEELRWWADAVKGESKREEEVILTTVGQTAEALELDEMPHQVVWLPKCRLAASLSIFSKKFAFGALQSRNSHRNDNKDNDETNTNTLLGMFHTWVDLKALEQAQLEQRQWQQLYQRLHYPSHYIPIGSISEYFFKHSESLYSSAQELHKQRRQLTKTFFSTNKNPNDQTNEEKDQEGEKNYATSTTNNKGVEDGTIGFLFYEWAKGMYRRAKTLQRLEHYNGSYSAYRRAARLFQKTLSFLHGKAILQSFSMLTAEEKNLIRELYPEVVYNKLKVERGWFEVIVHGFVLWGRCLERMTYLYPTDSNIQVIAEDYLYSWKNHSVRMIVEGFGDMRSSNEERLAQQMLQPMKALCLLQNRYIRRLNAERVIAHLLPFQGSSVGREASRTLTSLAALKQSTPIEPILTNTQKMLLSSLDIVSTAEGSKRDPKLKRLVLENSDIIDNLFVRRTPFYFSCHFLPFYSFLYQPIVGVFFFLFTLSF